MTYLYDGSFEGLLCSIFEAFERKEYPDAILPDEDAQYTLDKMRDIETDLEKSRRVYDGIGRKISALALENAYLCFISKDLDASRVLLEYLRLGFKYGRKVDERLAEDSVMKVTKIARNVNMEKHHYVGFLRFSSLEGGLYFAQFEPENNVLPLLMPHFADRLNTQPFIVHDNNRKVAGVYNGTDWFLISSASMNLPEYSSDEMEYRRLWKGFFDAIGIKERASRKRQRQMMPLKYRKYMWETQG